MALYKGTSSPLFPPGSLRSLSGIFFLLDGAGLDTPYVDR